MPPDDRDIFHVLDDLPSKSDNYRPFSWPQHLIWLLLAIIGVYGIYEAITHAWVADNAFISFRYARNLLDGQGLVFNHGVRVEGYTNFLWTIMIAGAMKFKIDPILFTQVTGIASYILTVLIVLFISIRLSVRISSKRIIFPIAAAALLLQYDFQIFATSGLETAWITMLITLAFALLTMTDSKLSFFATGIFLTASILSRPDALIFFLMGLPYIFLQSRKPFGKIILYLVPFAVIFIPYWFIRYNYYGYPFPNVYYARLTYMSWYTQGLIYLWTYLKTNYILLLVLPALALIVPRLMIQFLTDKCFAKRIDRVWLLSLFFIVPYIFFVLRTGGGFMHARFFIPITPICFIVLETVLLSLGKRTIVRSAFATAVVLAVLIRWNQFPTRDTIISGINDEYERYSPEKIDRAKIDGGKLNKYLRNLNVVVGYELDDAALIYYSQLPMAVNCKSGLTDEYLAHLPLEQRGRTGQNLGVLEEYIKERRVNFMPIDIEGVKADQVGIVSFDGAIMGIIIYDNILMDALKEYPEVHFVDFQEFLDKYLASLSHIPTDNLIADFRRFKGYYFDYNDDSERLNRFVNEIDARKNGDVTP